MMESKTLKVILLDIETSPILGYTWTTWDANVLQILESSKVISVAWKELFSKDTTVKAICDYKDYEIYVSPYARAKATLHAMNHKSEGNGRRSSARDGLWKAKCSVY